MKLCNYCAAILTLQHHGQADLHRTGASMEFIACERCGAHRPVIEYEIIDRPKPPVEQKE